MGILLHAVAAAESSYSPISLFGHYGQAVTFDHSLFDYAASVRTPQMVSLAEIVTWFGETEVAAIIIALALAYLWRKELYAWIAPFLVGVFGAQATTALLKILVARPRPLGAAALAEITYSFPSGHATIAATLYGFLGYIAYRQTGKKAYLWLGGVAAILVGASRVILGIHYPNDVLAGFVVGFIWIQIAIHTERKWHRGR